MADLVPGDGANLVERRILERDVGDGDARRAADAAGIGGEIVRLPRAVEHEHPLGRHARAAGHFDHGVADLARRHRLIFVEQGLDQDRRQQDEDGEDDAVSPPDQIHQRFPVRRISQ